MRLYLGSLRQWHWISSAVCLVGMLLFAITGITLNHAAQIQTEPHILTVEASLPPAVLAQIVVPEQSKAPLPESVKDWLRKDHGIVVHAQRAEWSDEEIYLSLPRPGGDAWLSIDLVSGELLYERTERGWISYFNDLHKGRNTGSAWSWFIDIFSVACIIFCVTGLLLLVRYADTRPSTWPLVGLGVLVPLILIILFIH
jgi:hypothetical protein